MLRDRTEPDLVALCNIRPGNGVGYSFNPETCTWHSPGKVAENGVCDNLLTK